MRRFRFSPSFEAIEKRLVLSSVTPTVDTSAVATSDVSGSGSSVTPSPAANAQTSDDTGWSAFIGDDSFTIPYFCDVPTDEPSGIFDPVYYANG